MKSLPPLTQRGTGEDDRASHLREILHRKQTLQPQCSPGAESSALPLGNLKYQAAQAHLTAPVRPPTFPTPSGLRQPVPLPERRSGSFLSQADLLAIRTRLQPPAGDKGRARRRRVPRRSTGRTPPPRSPHGAGGAGKAGRRRAGRGRPHTALGGRCAAAATARSRAGAGAGTASGLSTRPGSSAARGSPVTPRGKAPPSAPGAPTENQPPFHRVPPL